MKSSLYKMSSFLLAKYQLERTSCTFYSSFSTTARFLFLFLRAFCVAQSSCLSYCHNSTVITLFELNKTEESFHQHKANRVETFSSYSSVNKEFLSYTSYTIFDTAFRWYNFLRFLIPHVRSDQKWQLGKICLQKTSLWKSNLEIEIGILYYIQFLRILLHFPLYFWLFRDISKPVYPSFKEEFRGWPAAGLYRVFFLMDPILFFNNSRNTIRLKFYVHVLHMFPFCLTKFYPKRLTRCNDTVTPRWILFW